MKIPRLIKDRIVINTQTQETISVEKAYKLCGSRGRIGWDYFLKC